jgi:hypothetical protein
MYLKTKCSVSNITVPTIIPKHNIINTPATALTLKGFGLVSADDSKQ